MQRVGAIILLVVVVAVEASAQMLTGKDLQRYCDSTRLDYEGGICRGYVEGVLGSARSTDKSGRPKTHADGTWDETLFGHRWCLPETASVDKLVAVFNRWLVAHPEALPREAARSIAESLAEAFPCKRTK